MPDTRKWPPPDLISLIHRASERIKRQHHAVRPDLFPPPNPMGGALAALEHVIVEKNRWLELEAQNAELKAQLAEPEGLRDGWASESIAAAVIGKLKGKRGVWSKPAAYRWLNRLVAKHPEWKRKTDEFGIEYYVRGIIELKSPKINRGRK